MATYPKISIVTPSYNQGRYLEETIRSVLDQGYPNLEYIIIDGGSSDNSKEIIDKYKNRLSYCVSEPDNGMYSAIQKGFERSSGEILAWINSDDVYQKNAFFVVAEIFQSFPDVKWIQGLPSFTDEQNRLVAVNNFRGWSKYDFYMRDYEWIQQESCFWRRGLWVESGGKFNENLKLAADFDLWARFFKHGELYSLNTVLASFRMRTKDQKSLESMNAYKAEVKQVYDTMMAGVTEEESRTLKRLRFFKNYLMKIPVLKKKSGSLVLENDQPSPAYHF